MVSRRRFLQQVSGGAAFLSASSILAGAKPQRRIRIGAQTNAWGVPIKSYDHLLEILDRLVQLGYEGFETGYLSLEAQRGAAKQCRAAFESRHIEYIAPHCLIKFTAAADSSSQVEDLRRIAHYSAEMGAKHLISSGSGTSNARSFSFEQRAELLNQVGKACQQEGLKFCYFNHRHDFEGNPPEMDVFLAQTDPKLVWFAYDAGTAYPIGPNPGDFSAEHFRRILIYHIDDFIQNSSGKTVSVDLGTGKIDLKAVVAPLLKSDWQGWLVAEREVGYPNAAPNPEALLQQSRTYIRKITGI